jgi:integrase/recombinase XerD
VRLHQAIRVYVERKRSSGLIYVASEFDFLSFAKQVGDVPLGSVTVRQVSAFLSGPKTSPVTWRHKYGFLKHFFEYWAARGLIEILPLPAPRAFRPRIFVPYIYSRTELRLLLRTIRLNQKRAECMIEPKTFRAFLLFLYATGTLTGEALRLRREDIDFNKCLLTIRGNRFNRVRCIPIGPDLRTRLQRYVQWTARKKDRAPNLFLGRDGKAINVVTLAKNFQRLRRRTGIARHDGATYQPRLHDLRHTFAVHRLSSWLKQGADLNRMLPALSAYLGQVGLASTERYLSMTPERFRKQLTKLSPKHRKKRWRDDPLLMKFLAEL